MVGRSLISLPREVSSVNLGEEDDYVELEDKQVGEEVQV